MPVDCILQGDCVAEMAKLPASSVDMIFADPPYHLQLQKELLRPNQTVVDGVDDDWDKFENPQAYEDFTRAWLTECHRLLKADGSIWVIGSYHNIFRVGKIMMDLGFWVLNDVVWHKTNPMPNFRGRRFTNATETMIWAAKSQKSKYTFNYAQMKAHNEGLQMQNVWHIPLCTGAERLKGADGAKAHATQKPEALLFRVIAASSKPNDLVLDPFFGTGTTGAVAKKLGRRYLGIERETSYIQAATRRIEAIEKPLLPEDELWVPPQTSKNIRVSLASLMESGLMVPGQSLTAKRNVSAKLRIDGQLEARDAVGSIHDLPQLLGVEKNRINGWHYWYVETQQGPSSIDTLRQTYLKNLTAGQAA